MREITKADSGAELDVRVGNTLTLRLPENPTTGYRWHMRSSGGPVLELQEDSFAPSTEAVGAGGMRCWTFQVVAAGVARVEVDELRSWERRPIDTFDVTVRVTGE